MPYMKLVSNFINIYTYIHTYTHTHTHTFSRVKSGTIQFRPEFYVRAINMKCSQNRLIQSLVVTLGLMDRHTDRQKDRQTRRK